MALWAEQCGKWALADLPCWEALRCPAGECLNSGTQISLDVLYYTCSISVIGISSPLVVVGMHLLSEVMVGRSVWWNSSDTVGQREVTGSTQKWGGPDSYAGGYLDPHQVQQNPPHFAGAALSENISRCAKTMLLKNVFRSLGSGEWCGGFMHASAAAFQLGSWVTASQWSWLTTPSQAGCCKVQLCGIEPDTYN